jgi:ATP-dependent helicase IRC3
MKRQTRPYQVEANDTVFMKLSAGVKNQLLVLATGMGKTYVATQIIERLKVYLKKENVKILWMTHTEDLIEQSAIAVLRELTTPQTMTLFSSEEDEAILDITKTKINLLTDERIKEVQKHIGIIKLDQCDFSKPITVASVQSLCNRLHIIPADTFDCIIIDEAHMAAAQTWTKSINHFSGVKLRLGLTATPERLDGVSLSDLFDEIVFERDIYFGVKNKYLCPLTAYRIKTGIDLSKVKSQGGDFNQKQLEAVVDTDERNQLIVDKWLYYAKGRPTIMFCVNVQHAMRLSEAFNQNGISSTFVVGDKNLCPDRRERLSGLKNGKYEVITNVNILTAGYDYNEISCIGLARPTQSKTLYLQSLGRGTRVKYGEFEDCILLDIVDNNSRHSLINTWTLEKGMPVEDRIFMNPELLAKIEEARIARVTKMKEVEVEEEVDLLQLPKIEIRNSFFQQTPANDAQLNKLRELGFDVENTFYTKGQATELLGNQSCSEAELNELAALNYDVSNGATKAQYRTILATVDTSKIIKSTTNFILPFKL